MYFGIRGIRFEEITTLEGYVSEFITNRFDGDESEYIKWVDNRRLILSDVLKVIEELYGQDIKDKALSIVGYDVRYHFATSWDLHDLEGAYVKKSANVRYEDHYPSFKDTEDYKKYVDYWNSISNYDMILFSDLNDDPESNFNRAVLDLMAEAHILAKDFDLGSDEYSFIELCNDKCIVHDRYRKAHTRNMKRAEENLRSKRMNSVIDGLM